MLLTSSQTISPVLPALVGPPPAVASSVAGGSLEVRRRVPGLPGPFGRVGEMKGGCGEAGGAGGFPAGWKPAFQDGQAILRKRLLACSTSLAMMRGSREFRSGWKKRP
jgi:hypothetical protein